MAQSGKHTWWSLPLILLAGFFITVLLANSEPVQQIEYQITDRLFEIRGPIAIQDTTVVIVTISQQADEAIRYKYPWPTRLYAKLIENLNKAGAKAIGIDVIFDQPDNYNAANDSIFAAALSKYDNVVLAANLIKAEKSRGGGGISKYRTLVEPNSVLSSSPGYHPGLVTMPADMDEEIRRYYLQLAFNNKTYSAMALQLLKIYNGWEAPKAGSKNNLFYFGTYKIPKYDRHTMAINYFGPADIFPQYSFETVIDDSTILLEAETADFQFNTFSDPNFGLLQSGVFKDKIVLIGATMKELHDFHATPFATAGNRPGVTIHANALQTILTGNYIQYATPWLNLILLIFSLLLMMTATRLTKGFWSLSIFVLLSFGIVAMSLISFIKFNFIINATGPLIALTVGYLSTLSYEYVTEQREKKRIHSMFASYLAPAVVDEMIASGKNPQLGGDEIYMTAFFSDIQSFSTFSEKLKPHQLVTLINEYLTAMTDIITDEGGTLDKYIGDAIVAFFGAPVAFDDHANRACVISLRMQKRLHELTKKWQSDGEKWPELVLHMRNRIGINTGTMITGNMGSTQRFNYTVMGDAVNLAARCESGAKNYGVYTMVTGETKKQAEKYGDSCVFRFLDKIIVKGKTKPVEVFEILGLKVDISPETLNCKRLFEQAVERYKNRNWEEAISLFEEANKLEASVPDSKKPLVQTNPSLVYLERCKYMKKNPPGSSWDGIYEMTRK